MIENDAEILKHFVENWKKVIPLWVDEHKQNLTARNILHRRDVGAEVTIDVVEKYDKTGPGAQITAKGAVPKTFGVKTKSEPFEIHQISTGFNISAKDLKVSPMAKARLVEIALNDIHEAEDNIALNGSTPHNITGIVAAARANANGKITAAANKGKWTGEQGTDIYTDVSDAIGLLDSKYKPSFLVGNRTSMRNLYHKDSERNPYYADMGILFGKTDPKDLSWIWQSDWLADGYVYVVCKDTMAADFVVSEDPDIITYPMVPGQVYPIEVYSWSEPELYTNEAFVEIAIT